MITRHTIPILCAPWSSVLYCFPADLTTVSLATRWGNLALFTYMTSRHGWELFVPRSWVYPA